MRHLQLNIVDLLVLARVSRSNLKMHSEKGIDEYHQVTYNTKSLRMLKTDRYYIRDMNFYSDNINLRNMIEMDIGDDGDYVVIAVIEDNSNKKIIVRSCEEYHGETSSTIEKIDDTYRVKTDGYRSITVNGRRIESEYTDDSDD